MRRALTLLVISILMTRTRAGLQDNGRKEFRVRGHLKLALFCLAVLLFALASEGNAVAQSWNLQELSKEARALKPADIQRVSARAQSGEARAQFILGLALEFGYGGLTKDNAEALRWFRQAADQGIGLPEKWVGDFYYAGTAGPKDFAEALRYYRRAAEHDYAPGAQFLAQMSVFGEGAAADHREAARWFRRAVELGDQTSKEYVAFFDSPCQDDFCVALRKLVYAVLTKQLLSRYRGQKKPDATRSDLYEVTRILPGAKDCSLEVTRGWEDSSQYKCLFQEDAAEPHMTQRFNQLVGQVKAALPAGWAGEITKDGHGWPGFSANPPLSDQERKELEARDWMGWEPLVRLDLSGFTYLGKPSSSLYLTVQFNK